METVVGVTTKLIKLRNVHDVVLGGGSTLLKDRFEELNTDYLQVPTGGATAALTSSMRMMTFLIKIIVPNAVPCQAFPVSSPHSRRKSFAMGTVPSIQTQCSLLERSIGDRWRCDDGVNQAQHDNLHKGRADIHNAH